MVQMLALPRKRARVKIGYGTAPTVIWTKCQVALAIVRVRRRSKVTYETYDDVLGTLPRRVPLIAPVSAWQL